MEPEMCIIMQSHYQSYFMNMILTEIIGSFLYIDINAPESMPKIPSIK